MFALNLESIVSPCFTVNEISFQVVILLKNYTICCNFLLIIIQSISLSFIYKKSIILILPIFKEYLAVFLIYSFLELISSNESLGLLRLFTV